jgi:hypothetical protein
MVKRAVKLLEEIAVAAGDASVTKWTPRFFKLESSHGVKPCSILYERIVVGTHCSAVLSGGPVIKVEAADEIDYCQPPAAVFLFYDRH